MNVAHFERRRQHMDIKEVLLKFFQLPFSRTQHCPCLVTHFLFFLQPLLITVTQRAHGSWTVRLRPTVSIRTSARCRFASSSRTPTAAALSCTTTKTSSQLLTASTPLGTFSLMYKSPFLTIIVVRILFTDHLTTLSASADQITEQGCLGRYMYIIIIIIDIERK